MRASMLLRSAAKPHTNSKFPYEVWPLFVAMGFVCCFAGYRAVKNLGGPEVRKTRSGETISRGPKIEGEHH